MSLADEIAWHQAMLAETERRYLTGVRVPAGVSIRLTCESTPEQYDVLRGRRKIGYVRFRYALLTVEYPDAYGELLFEEHWPVDSRGDEYRSEWDTQDQRAHDLTRFLEMLVKRDNEAPAL